MKLDVGVHVNGYVGDNAVTIYLGSDPQLQLLVEACRAARDAAVAFVKAGVTPHEFGAAIEREITSRGLQPIRNLSRHDLAQYVIHTEPSIPNFANNDRKPLAAGTIIAIEPFATTGAGKITHKGEPTAYAISRWKAVRAPLASPSLNVLINVGKWRK